MPSWLLTVAAPCATIGYIQMGYIGFHNIFIPRLITDLCHNLTIDRDQIVLVPHWFAPVPERQLFPGSRLRRDWCLNLTIPDLSVGQGQDAVMGVWEASGIREVADL